MSWFWLGLSILCEVTATLSLRASDGFRKRLRLIPADLGYAITCTLLSLAPSAGMPVGDANGIWTSAGIILIAVLARSLWKGPLTGRMLMGMAISISGVLLVEFGGTH